MGETFEGIFKDNEAYNGKGTIKYPWGIFSKEEQLTEKKRRIKKCI